MDKPIIFSAPMIRALLDGRKTQTRRIPKPQPWLSQRWTWEPRGHPICAWFDGPPYIPETDALAMDHVPCAIGDRLWARETFSESPLATYYCATGVDPATVKWKPPTHMPLPCWASRLTLEVTGVKVERLQDISAEDAIAEGIDFNKHKCGCELCSRTSQICPATTSSLVMEFAELWRSIHGADAWEANSWIYAVTFNVHKSNIDAIEKSSRKTLWSRFIESPRW